MGSSLDSSAISSADEEREAMHNSWIDEEKMKIFEEAYDEREYNEGI